MKTLFLALLIGCPKSADVEVVDADGDGLTVEAGDCDDSSAAINPLADDAAGDGIDTNCDGADGNDHDADGVQADADCDDEDPARGAATTWYVDEDGDGYGLDDGTAETVCEPRNGFANASGDCADSNPSAFPGAVETCNTIDDDCDGKADDTATDAPTWYADVDADGYGDPDVTERLCEAPADYVENGDDCDDSTDQVRPGYAEYCDDLDNNCDGAVDAYSPPNPDGPSVIGTDTYCPDDDKDGYAYPDPFSQGICVNSCSSVPGMLMIGSGLDDCDDTDPNVYKNAPNEIACDGIDTNCSNDPGTSDEDKDRDTHTITACGGNDCDDSRPDTYTGAIEWCDGRDNDCDGQIDDGCI